MYMKIQERNKKEWINKQNNQKNKQTKAEIIPSNIYSNYEEKENEIVLDAYTVSTTSRKKMTNIKFY